MKRIYLIGGTMGVGKTAVCQELKRRLERAVFLDGDWCWDSSPFQVTEETKAMVLENICFLLNQFIRCGAYQNIIFCWVMHRQDIIDKICAELDTAGGCVVRRISLVCQTEALKARVQADVDAGKRQPDALERSLSYLPLYEALDTVKIDVTSLTVEEAAAEIETLG